MPWRLMGAFAIIALMMAAVGIYGLIGYLVGRRTHELGVRMALGARRSEVFRLVLRNAMSMALTGVAIGFLISLALPRLVVASFSGFHVRAAWFWPAHLSLSRSWRSLPATRRHGELRTLILWWH